MFPKLVESFKHRKHDDSTYYRFDDRSYAFHNPNGKSHNYGFFSSFNRENKILPVSDSIYFYHKGTRTSCLINPGDYSTKFSFGNNTYHTVDEVKIINGKTLPNLTFVLLPNADITMDSRTAYTLLQLHNVESLK